MNWFGKRRKKSAILGRPHAEGAIPTTPDPFDQDRRNEQEQERSHATPGESGLAIRWWRIGPLKIPVGFRIGLSIGGRFGSETKEQKRYNDARRKGRFRWKG